MVAENLRRKAAVALDPGINRSQAKVMEMRVENAGLRAEVAELRAQLSDAVLAAERAQSSAEASKRAAEAASASAKSAHEALARVGAGSSGPHKPAEKKIAVEIPAAPVVVAKPKPTAQEKELLAFANTAIKQGNLLFKQGDFAGSEKMLAEVGERCPKETRHLKYLGNAVMAQSRYIEGERIFRRWAEIEPDLLEPVSKIADALAGQHRQIEAAEALEAFMARTKPDSNLRRRIQTHRNLAGQPNPAVAKIRDEALAVKSREPNLDAVQSRVLRELKETGIAMTNYNELFGGNGALWEEAEQEFAKFGQDTAVVDLIQRISSARDFSQDPELSKLFKPSIVNYRKFFGDLTVESPITKLYYSDRILGIANGYNEMASKIRNMHMWINPPLHPENVNGRKGSQLWHRDQEDSRILKCFIYFSDIDEGSGATDFVKNTGVDCAGLKDQVIPYPATSGYPQEEMFKTRIPKEDFVRAVGPKGTIVFLDTNGFHRGGFVKERARHIAMCTFLRPVSPYVAMNTKVAATPEELALLPETAAYGIS